MRATKRVLRWRTALVLRELEAEVQAIEAFRARENELAARMRDKEALEAELAQARLFLQRRRHRYGPPVAESEEALESTLHDLRAKILALDVEILPLAKATAELSNATWGLLTRAGNDKSHLMRQIERYADVYTSRVSNLMAVTPHAYLRASRGTMPHDPAAGVAEPGDN